MSHSINQNITPAGLLKFAAPSIIMMVLMSLYTIVDGIFISRYVGTLALSAVNMSYPLNSLEMALGIMLGTGGSAIIARELGEGKERRARTLSTGAHTNPAQALSGAVAGLRVQQTSGNPNSTPTLVLRGHPECMVRR